MYPQVSEDIECTSPLTSLKFSSDLQFLNLGGELWQPHAARSCYNEEQITSALNCQDQTDGEQGNRQVEGGSGGNSSTRFGLQGRLTFQAKHFYLTQERPIKLISSAFHVIS